MQGGIVVDIGYMNEGDNSITIPTTIELPPPPKLCPFLDNVHCTDPRNYKKGLPDDPNDRYLCTLGKFGMTPRWCKEYPYQKKKYFVLLKLREFIQKSTSLFGNITKSRGNFDNK